MAYGYGFAMVLWWVPMIALMVILITALVRLATPLDRHAERVTVPAPQTEPPEQERNAR